MQEKSEVEGDLIIRQRVYRDLTTPQQEFDDMVSNIRDLSDATMPEEVIRELKMFEFPLIHILHVSLASILLLGPVSTALHSTFCFPWRAPRALWHYPLGHHA